MKKIILTICLGLILSQTSNNLIAEPRVTVDGDAPHPIYQLQIDKIVVLSERSLANSKDRTAAIESQLQQLDQHSSLNSISDLARQRTKIAKQRLNTRATARKKIRSLAAPSNNRRKQNIRSKKRFRN